MPELTSPQIAFGSVTADGELPKSARDSVSWYKKVRLMRKQPTVKLARLLASAVLMSAEWGVESKDDAPEGAKEFIRDQMFPVRSHILGTAYKGCSDFGWQPYEKVFGVNAKNEMVLQKLKPLLQDITKIVVDPETGAFAGFLNSPGSGEDVIVDLTASLLINLEVEGTDWYGISDMEAIEIPYDNWMQTNTSNTKYDKKIAGAHWVIHYPPGTSKIDGVDTDNIVVAQSLLTRLEGSGSFIVPRTLQKYVENLQKDESAWKIELITAEASTGAAFIERMKYLDALFFRGEGLPERTALEGQFGTKAEAGEHGDFAISNIEQRHNVIVQQINWHVVNQLLRFNYGEQYENTVSITVAPLTDSKRALLQKVYQTILASPEGFAGELDNVDVRAVRDTLGVPTITPEQRAIEDDADIRAAEDQIGNLLPAA